MTNLRVHLIGPCLGSRDPHAPLPLANACALPGATSIIFLTGAVGTPRIPRTETSTPPCILQRGTRASANNGCRCAGITTAAHCIVPDDGENPCTVRGAPSSHTSRALCPWCPFSRRRRRCRFHQLVLQASRATAPASPVALLIRVATHCPGPHCLAPVGRAVMAPAS